MDDVDRLVSLAQQLAGRVHDDDPEANRRWLLAVTTPEDRWALLFVLAAMVPLDRPVSRLLAWTDLWSHLGTGGPDTPEAIAQRRQVLTEALRTA